MISPITHARHIDTLDSEYAGYGREFPLGLPQNMKTPIRHKANYSVLNSKGTVEILDSKKKNMHQSIAFGRTSSNKTIKKTPTGFN